LFPNGRLRRFTTFKGYRNVRCTVLSIKVLHSWLFEKWLFIVRLLSIKKNMPLISRLNSSAWQIFRWFGRRFSAYWQYLNLTEKK
jgi:hypothetical protein